MPNLDILIIFFSTAAVIVATLTGLIGAFATFKLQKIETKLDFLKDYTMHKEVEEEKTLNHKIREHHYLNIRQIYVHNLEAIKVLKNCIDELDYHNHSEEYHFDLENITNFQIQYDNIRNLTKDEFTKSLVFVITNLLFLLFANFWIESYFWKSIIGADFMIMCYIFSLFIKQIKLLMA
jgi:hypothetical protein